MVSTAESKVFQTVATQELTSTNGALLDVAAVVMIVADSGSTISTADIFLFRSTNGFFIPVAGVADFDALECFRVCAFNDYAPVQAAVSSQHFAPTTVTFCHCPSPLSEARVHGQGLPLRQVYRLRSERGRPPEPPHGSNSGQVQQHQWKHP